MGGKGSGACSLSWLSSRVEATDSLRPGERKRCARRWISAAVRTLPRRTALMPWATSRAAPSSN